MGKGDVKDRTYGSGRPGGQAYARIQGFWGGVGPFLSGPSEEKLHFPGFWHPHSGGDKCLINGWVCAGPPSGYITAAHARPLMSLSARMTVIGRDGLVLAYRNPLPVPM
jgi:hypothetical protein